jgi:outer membrane lipoprotein-sorting protein
MKSVCAYVICGALAVSASFAAPSPAAAGLKDVINRMDQAAGRFHSMSANVTKTQHTAVLNDNSTESGSVYMRKTGKGLEALMDIVSPDKKTYAFQGRQVQIYTPNIKRVDIYDIGASSQQLAEQFFTLGFGTSGSDLEKNYNVEVAGQETVNGQNTTHVVLVPKTGEAKKLIKEVDLWLGDADYPVQEKILEPSGDYLLYVYSNVQINPKLTDQQLKLKLPSGVQKFYPQKQ